MLLGMWTSYFMDLSPEEMVEQFAEKGWHELELSDEHGKVLLERGEPSSVGREFRRFAGDLGVFFPQGHLWLTANIAADNQREVLDHLKRWLDLFAAIGIRAAVLHPGRNPDCTAQELLERRVKALHGLIGHIRGTDVIICLENLVSAAPEAEDLLEILEHVQRDRLAICLDTGHLNLSSKKQKDFILKAGRHLKALHIADNDGSSDQHLMPYGRGNVPWDEVVQGLKAINYRGLWNLEIPGERRCPLSIRLAKLDYIKVMMELMVQENQ
ncbi:MAG: sugar phosphate isomerase/epimerase family protein [Clostridia bacterium]|jgi:sugar phosphate isomerase/epimerase